MRRVGGWVSLYLGVEEAFPSVVEGVPAAVRDEAEDFPELGDEGCGEVW